MRAWALWWRRPARTCNENNQFVSTTTFVEAHFFSRRQLWITATLMMAHHLRALSPPCVSGRRFAAPAAAHTRRRVSRLARAAFVDQPGDDVAGPRIHQNQGKGAHRRAPRARLKTRTSMSSRTRRFASARRVGAPYVGVSSARHREWPLRATPRRVQQGKGPGGEPRRRGGRARALVACSRWGGSRGRSRRASPQTRGDDDERAVGRSLAQQSASGRERRSVGRTRPGGRARPRLRRGRRCLCAGARG